MTASGLKMLIDLEGAHAFYVSIFGGVEHLPTCSARMGRWCSGADYAKSTA